MMLFDADIINLHSDFYHDLSYINIDYLSLIYFMILLVFRETMGASLVPVLFFTLLWGAVGAILPFFIPANPHKSVIQVKVVY